MIIITQQTFDRRSKFVKKGKEAKFWDDVTVEMMSDEEKRGDVYVRHQPMYRSDALNGFIKKLDERSAASSSHAKFQRVVGTPAKKIVPASAKKWIIRPMSSYSGAVNTQGDDNEPPPSEDMAREQPPGEDHEQPCESSDIFASDAESEVF